MASTRAALADNLSAIFPEETRSELERRALTTLRSYARDVIDFLRALQARGPVEQLFELSGPDRALFDGLRGQGRGVILVTGHFGYGFHPPPRALIRWMLAAICRLTACASDSRLARSVRSASMTMR